MNLALKGALLEYILQSGPAMLERSNTYSEEMIHYIFPQSSSTEVKTLQSNYSETNANVLLFVFTYKQKIHIYICVYIAFTYIGTFK